MHEREHDGGHDEPLGGCERVVGVGQEHAQPYQGRAHYLQNREPQVAEVDVAQAGEQQRQQPRFAGRLERALAVRALGGVSLEHLVAVGAEVLQLRGRAVLRGPRPRGLHPVHQRLAVPLRHVGDVVRLLRLQLDVHGAEQALLDVRDVAVEDVGAQLARLEARIDLEQDEPLVRHDQRAPVEEVHRQAEEVRFPERIQAA